MAASGPKTPPDLDIVAVFAQMPEGGGGFHQSLNSLATLAEVCAGQHRLRVVVMEGLTAFPSDFTKALPALQDLEWIVPPTSGLRQTLLGVLRRLGFSRLPRHVPHRFWKPGKGRFLDSLGADLVYFLSPNGTALSLSATPFVMTVWDLCHLDFPEFPEVRAGGEFERRHSFFLRALPQAVLVVTDSTQLSARVHERYGVDEDRLLVQPFQPSPFLLTEGPSVTEVLEVHQLQPGYWFYPAQFWAHKNHGRILEALVLLRERGLVECAVFAGSDKGFRTKVESYARDLGVDGQVRFLGFVSADHLRALYLASAGLVFPSYFGPTNLPPLEAIMLGRPVVCSDFHRATLGDQARYFDPDDPFDLAAAMESVVRGETQILESGEPAGAPLRASGSISSDDRVGALRNRLEELSRRLGMLSATRTQ
jgi:glycosyltransferase involved in cell wall biosynthesis